MGMCAIFKMDCCGREIIFGRFSGNEMYPPTLRKCRFGCPPKLGPRGRPEEVVLRFVRYQGDDRLSPELYATWRFPDKTISVNAETIEKKDEDLLF